MKIVGHRGAAGLALQNSSASFKAALKAHVDMIELDVRPTKDGRLVVIHDYRTKRVATQDAYVGELTLAELQKLTLQNGEHLLSLDEALDLIGKTPVIVDMRTAGCAEELLNVVDRHPKANLIFASFQHEELRILRAAQPRYPIYVLEHFSPVEIVRSAVRVGADGIGLNMWLMNPLTYRLVKSSGLDLYVYNVNWPILARFLLHFYPGIKICTDYPNRYATKPKQVGTRRARHA
jgi:glycerophosphoryl diester phosphodiesterase